MVVLTFLSDNLMPLSSHCWHRLPVIFSVREYPAFGVRSYFLLKLGRWVYYETQCLLSCVLADFTWCHFIGAGRCIPTNSGGRSQGSHGDSTDTRATLPRSFDQCNVWGQQADSSWKGGGVGGGMTGGEGINQRTSMDREDATGIGLGREGGGARWRWGLGEKTGTTVTA